MAKKSKKQIEQEKKESEQNAAAIKQQTRRRIEDIMEQREFDKMFGNYKYIPFPFLYSSQSKISTCKVSPPLFSVHNEQRTLNSI